MPTLTRNLNKGDPLHEKLISRLSSRIKMAEKQQQRKHDQWRRNEEAVLAYLPETDEDALRKDRRDDGLPQYTTIIVPYTYGMLMTAHTYLTSVFLGRTPVHQFMGRHGETEQQTQALEALIGYQVDVGMFLAPYYIWVYDGLKMGLGVIGEHWINETIQYGRVQEIVDPTTGKPTRVQTTQSVSGYQGNKIRNVSVFDWFHDPRVAVGQFQKGEFCFERKPIMWNELIRRSRMGFYTEAVKEIRTTGRFPTPEGGTISSALERPEDQNLEDRDHEGKVGNHPAFVRVYEIYVDLIPSEWELGGSDFPEKWVFTMTADRERIIGAQPLGLIHGQFPFSVIETEIEAYGEYNRGMPEVLQGLQQTMDWLLNSHFWNVRQTMNNQFIVDPSRVIMKDVTKGGPGFVWRLRPEAYGTDPKLAVTQVETRDVTAAHIADIQNVFSLGERTLGVNEQMMGAPPQGGRVTATAVRTSTGFGVNRLKTIAEYISATAFAEHATRLVQNTQQYYDAPQKLRIVGDLIQEAGPGFMQVSPQDIAGRWSFVPVDGTLPIDRFAQATLWKDMFGQISRIPSIAASYDLGRIFAWVAQLSGLKNIHKFKVQMGSPEQLMQMAQAGNVIPLRGQAPGGPSSLAAGGPQLQGVNRQ